MKPLRIILLVLGYLFVVVNFFGYVGNNGKIPVPRTTGVNKVAFFIGYNFLFIFGVIFLIIAFLIGQRLKKKERKKMVDSLFQQGETTSSESH
jgi:hypothetical protein